MRIKAKGRGWSCARGLAKAKANPVVDVYKKYLTAEEAVNWANLEISKNCLTLNGAMPSKDRNVYIWGGNLFFQLLPGPSGSIVQGDILTADALYAKC